MKRSALSPMSEKRRAALADAGVVPSSTFLPSLRRTPRPQYGTSVGGSVGGVVAGEGRLPFPRARGGKPTGPDRYTVEAVLERDNWSCVVCGGGLWGDRGEAWSIGHRRPRRAGGDPRPSTNQTANLITLHGSGTTGCHGLLESMRTQSEGLGWLLHANQVPADELIQHSIHGLVYLDNVGGYKKAGA